MSSDVFTQELKPVDPEAPTNEKTPGKNGHRTIKEIMADSGFNGLTQNSESEEIHTAITKFVAVTANFDSIKLGLAKSEIIKNLNKIKVKGARELVGDAFKKSDGGDNSKQGEVIDLKDPDPWPKEVDGAKLLDEITETFKRFLILPDSGAEAMALWILHSWSIDALIYPPQKGSPALGYPVHFYFFLPYPLFHPPQRHIP